MTLVTSGGPFITYEFFVPDNYSVPVMDKCYHFCNCPLLALLYSEFFWETSKCSNMSFVSPFIEMFLQYEPNTAKDGQREFRQ